MKNSETYFQSLISNGESEMVEFKSKLINQHDIAKVLTSFANTKGGNLIIGVGDNGEIIGLSEEEALNTKDRLQRICSSLFSFPFEVEKLTIKGKSIVFAKIDQAPEHLLPILTGNGDFYVREGNRTIRPTLDNKTLHSNEDNLKSKKQIVGFVAMSFRDEEEPSLIDYFEAMLRAVERTRLPIVLTRIDLKEGDFEISQQIMNEIDSCSFVIADFTLGPHNVYFEVGYARGKDRKVIQTARKGSSLQFNVHHWKTSFYRNATELEVKLIPRLISTYEELTK